MLNDFLNAYKEFWIKATHFKGFTSRSDWWLVQLANFIISLLTIPIFLKTFGFNAYGIVCIIPQIAIDIRRIRDFGKDWKWIFIKISDSSNINSYLRNYTNYSISIETKRS